MGLSDELVYCFYRLSTLGKRVCSQGNRRWTRLTNRFVHCQNIFTHDLYAPNLPKELQLYSRQILKETELFWATWFEILLEYSKSWSRNKGNSERSVIQIRFCSHRWSGPLKVPVFESNSSMIPQSIWEHVSQERSGLVWVDQLETKKNGATKKCFVFVMFPYPGGLQGSHNNVVNSHYSLSLWARNWTSCYCWPKTIIDSHKSFGHVQSRW